MNRFIIPVILIFALTGCSKNAATVNGNSISDSEISQIVSAQEQLMGQSSKDQEAAIRTNVVQKLIDQTLLLQEAKKQGITISEEEITQKYNDLKKIWDSNAETQKSLKAQGYTDENMKEKVRDQLLIDNLVKSLVQVTDQQLKDYYQSHLFLFSLYTTLTGQAQDEATAKKMSANKSILKENTVTFNQLPVQLQQAIREGKNVQDQSQIIKLDNANYSMVIVNKITQQSFDQVQSQAKDQLEQDQKITKTQELITELRKDAEISIK